MAWTGSLELNYRLDPHRASGAPARTVCHDRHDGPLRVLASLYPEDAVVCHNVLVHPPGGIVGGDQLHVAVQVAAGAHALITTPGATRFYRSAGESAMQTVVARVEDQARLEWLPLETIAHSGTLAENRMRFELVPGADMIGWDVVALGLPASSKAFESGRYTQQIELPGAWLERGTIAASDHRLLDSPLGWGGCRAMGTMWFARGSALPAPLRELLIDAARDAAQAATTLVARAGVTSPHDGIVVMRVLGSHTEAITALQVAVWKRWRELAWSMASVPPRVWKT
jgi:urease accessory protein